MNDDQNIETPEAAEQLQPPLQLKSNSLRISGENVRKAVASLPKEQADLIVWLYDYGQQHHLSIEQLADKINRDKNTLYQVFSGRHAAGKGPICRDIEAFKRIAMERGSSDSIQFVETSLSSTLFKFFDACRVTQRTGFVFGDSQIGKSKIAKEFVARNLGNTVYIRMPAGRSLMAVMYELGNALHLPSTINAVDRRRRILESFNSESLLIIDEAHQPFLGSSSENYFRAATIFEFFREIFDRCECGMVFLGTNVFKTEVESGRCSEILAQTARRRWCNLRLPAVPSQEDLNKFAIAFGYTPATGDAKKLQDLVIKRDALGQWITLLRMGVRMAEKKGETLDWEHVQKAFAARRRYEEL